MDEHNVVLINGNKYIRWKIESFFLSLRLFHGLPLLKDF